jgi:hypothetical protein
LVRFSDVRRARLSPEREWLRDRPVSLTARGGGRAGQDPAPKYLRYIPLTAGDGGPMIR